MVLYVIVKSDYIAAIMLALESDWCPGSIRINHSNEEIDLQRK